MLKGPARQIKYHYHQAESKEYLRFVTIRDLIVNRLELEAARNLILNIG